MDCLFNKGIPEGDESTIIIPPASKTFITGFAASYYLPYPLALMDYISEDKYKLEMEKINDMTVTYFPCSMCIGYGYLLALCTFGLSFC